MKKTPPSSGSGRSRSGRSNDRNSTQDRGHGSERGAERGADRRGSAHGSGPGGRDQRPGPKRPSSRRDDAGGARADDRAPRNQARTQARTRPVAQPRPAAAPVEPAAEEKPGKPALQASTGKQNLLYGLHAVAAAWVNPARTARMLFATEGALDALSPAFALATERGLDRPTPVTAEREQLDKLLPQGSVHQGVALDCAPLPEPDISDILIAAESEPEMLVVILDQVTDPHNVGAILRSAAAFGARAVIVQDRHAPPVTGVLAKTASGAVDAVPLVRVTNLSRTISELQQADFWCVGLAESGEKALHELDLSARTAIVMGSEGEGLRRLTAERCDEIARLPTGGPVGSLNVSNAAAVALYEVARRR